METMHASFHHTYYMEAFLAWKSSWIKTHMEEFVDLLTCLRPNYEESRNLEEGIGFLGKYVIKHW